MKKIIKPKKVENITDLERCVDWNKAHGKRWKKIT